METHEQRPLVPRPEAVAELAPRSVVRRGTRDLLEEVEVRVEEGEPGREVVDVEAALDGRLDVGEAVGEGEGKLGAAVEPASRMW